MRGKAYHDREVMRESMLLRVCVNPSSGLPSNRKTKIIWNIHSQVYHTHAYTYTLDENSINREYPTLKMLLRKKNRRKK